MEQETSKTTEYVEPVLEETRIPLISFIDEDLCEKLEGLDLTKVTETEKNLIERISHGEDVAAEHVNFSQSLTSLIIALHRDAATDDNKNGITLLVTSENATGTLQNEFSKKSLTSASLSDNPSELSDETVVVFGTSDEVSAFFTSDLGRATSIRRVFISLAQSEISEAAKEAVAEACKRGRRPQLILTTDELNNEGKDLIRSYFLGAALKETHYFYFTEADKEVRQQALLDFIEGADTGSLATLVYCNHASDAVEICSFLDNNGVPSKRLVGRVNQGKISSICKELKDGKAKALVCTDSATEHLSTELFSFMINFSVPSDPEVYINRTLTDPDTPADRVILNLITSLDEANFSYLKKVSEAQFLAMPRPNLEVIVRSEFQKLKNRLASENPTFDERHSALAAMIVADEESEKLISLLLKEAKSQSVKGKNKKQKRTNRFDDEDDTVDENENIDGSGDTERRQKREQKPQYTLRHVARLYIGQGENEGLSPDSLSDFIKEHTSDDLTPDHCIVREHYSFLDFPDEKSQEVLEILDGKAVLGIDELFAKKSIVITIKEPIVDQQEEESNSDNNAAEESAAEESSPKTTEAPAANKDAEVAEEAPAV